MDIISAIYLGIGLLIYLYENYYIKDEPNDFFDRLDKYNYVRYLIIIIILWLPTILLYLYLKKFTNKLDDNVRQ